jgi:recyclin-1
MAPRDSTASLSRGRPPAVSMQVLTPSRVFSPPPPSKMSLPIELLEQIVDYLPVQSQLTFARTSRAMRDMIYDDSRWVSKLKAMGAWNEEEARRAAEEEITRRREATQRARQEAVLGRTVTNGTNTTIFDASVESKKIPAIPVTPVKNTDDLLDFSFDSPEAFGDFQSVSTDTLIEKPMDSAAPLRALESVVSRRGEARQEFGKAYEVLAPLYINLTNSNSLEQSVAFRHRKLPEEQAKLLRVLELFGQSRAVDNWTRCQKRIAWITETFERQALTEFEEYIIVMLADFRGYDAKDVDGKMKRQARILYDLNGGGSCVRLFIRKHPSIFIHTEDPMLCITYRSKKLL